MKLLFYRVYEIYKYRKIANDYSSIQFNSLVNRSITIKKCFGYSQGPASGQNSVCENSRKTFLPLTMHKLTYRLPKKNILKREKYELSYKLYKMKMIYLTKRDEYHSCF